MDKISEENETGSCNAWCLEQGASLDCDQDRLEGKKEPILQGFGRKEWETEGIAGAKA